MYLNNDFLNLSTIFQARIIQACNWNHIFPFLLPVNGVLAQLVQSACLTGVPNPVISFKIAIIEIPFKPDVFHQQETCRYSYRKVNQEDCRKYLIL